MADPQIPKPLTSILSLTEGERRFFFEPHFIFISLRSTPSIPHALGVNEHQSQSQRGGVGRGLGVGTGLGVGVDLGTNSLLRIVPPKPTAVPLLASANDTPARS